ncbi:MAG: 2-keto-4-pentenoate hydratase [Saprospiraceae bacterium]
MNIKELAKTVDEAALNAKPIPQLSLENQFSEKDAYEIQATSIARRYNRGEKLVGIKLGFTSKAKMEQMGVHDMIWGRLTDKMLIGKNSNILLEKFIHPRAEPEICFLVKKEISQEVPMSEIKEYIYGVAGAIEIIDSRYQNFKFSLEDVIADNCSSAGFVIGKWYNIDTPIADLKMDLIINDEVVQSGSSNAILGDPWESVVAASRLCAQYGQVIKAGSYIMAGAATSAVYLEKNQSVKVAVESLGTIQFSIQ